MMTNREFLNSLSDEQFADWIFGRYKVEEQLHGYPELTSYTRYDGLNYVTLSFIDPYYGFLNWLKKKSVYKKALMEESNED